jgi:hypothetical protein
MSTLSVQSMKVGGGTLNNNNSDALGIRNSEQNYFSYNPNSINAYRSYNN